MASNFTTAYGLEASFLAQLVWELPSKEAAFELETVREMCVFEEELMPSLQHLLELDMGQPALQQYLRHFWSLPSYSSCLSPKAFNCSFLTQEDLDAVKDQVDECGPYRETILTCLNATNQNEQRCLSLPANCQSPYIKGLFYTSLSKEFFEPSHYARVHLLSLLPVFTRTAYLNQGFSYTNERVGVASFQRIEKRAVKLADQMKRMRLVGAKLGIKESLFDGALTRDFRWGILAAILVIAVIWIYAFSAFYTAMVVVCLVKSVIVAFFFYRFVFQIYFFPFMNLLSLVILIGIGSDDTFVLNFIFHRVKQVDLALILSLVRNGPLQAFYSVYVIRIHLITLET